MSWHFMTTTAKKLKTSGPFQYTYKSNEAAGRAYPEGNRNTSLQASFKIDGSPRDELTIVQLKVRHDAW
jgi:hypothetical protein